MESIGQWIEREAVIQHFLIIFLAVVCGWAIGYERSARNKQAGIKTHIIVAVTSALMMIISKEAFLDTPNFDTSRVAAQIVSGISFIGGGIIFMRDKKISGITTAAGVWATAGIGMAIGGGMWLLGLVCTLVVVMIQLLTHASQKNSGDFEIRIVGETADKTTLSQLYTYYHCEQYHSIKMEMKQSEQEELYEITISIEQDQSFHLADIENFLKSQELDLVVKRFVVRSVK
ncbi:MgtC/SapB family protein [Streptococcus panodentis]|uniref:Magnesium transporter MgtC n=1 Tax=Streptococcus panodentis TaxID=1581472 RepID=A0ABS5B0A1_9STRE|nr:MULTISPECIES: MgtC/SapB family protein [Streptococcus]KXT85288.1 Peptide transport system permease protein SapB [Streptococcus sp. DD11]MBP2622268.1 magnesium transporter MgtC [Streptococcus panodentis]